MSEPAEFSDAWRLARMREREHVLSAVVLAQMQWRDVLGLVAESIDAADACSRLAAHFGLDEIQSHEVIDTQYRRLPTSERARMEAELTEVRARIEELARSCRSEAE